MTTRLDAPPAGPPPTPRTEEERTLGPWRLIAQLSAGTDGVAFAGERAGERAVVYDLSRARRDPHRWQQLAVRLAKRRLLETPGLVPIVDVDVEPPRPWVALPAGLRPIEVALPLVEAEVLHVAAVLSRALAALHHIGLFVDEVGPDRVWLSAQGTSPMLEVVGLRCGAPSSSLLAAACSPAWAERA